jgi:Zn-dependent protease with chaperone function
MATTAPPLTCPQGHGPGVSGSRFCNFCGAQLVIALAATETVLMVQQAPEWQPVHTLQPVPAVQPVAVVPVASAVMASPKSVCKVCGGSGDQLDAAEDVCAECGWLRPLFPGYKLERSVFLWAQDGQAMGKLQKISALNAVVHSASDKVGRPWIESTFNGIRLGPKQLPDVWKLAVLAARILGLTSMPDVYVAGDQMWNTYTFGTDTSAFIVLGTAILTNFQNDELLYVLAREMGHCRAGHALWKTATRFLTGDISLHNGLLSNGLLHAISPTRLIEGAVEMPLMAWSRQSEITADRAGLLAVGDEALARRVLLAWSIRSSRLLKQVNIEEWMKQEEESDDKMTRFSEMTTSSSMYTTRRLRLLSQAAREPELMRWSQSVLSARKQLAPVKQPVQGTSASSSTSPPVPKDSIRVVCGTCQAAMRIPFTVLRGKASLDVRCPQCQNVVTLRPKLAAPSPAAAGAQEHAE